MVRAAVLSALLAGSIGWASATHAQSFGLCSLHPAATTPLYFPATGQEASVDVGATMVSAAFVVSVPAITIDKPYSRLGVSIQPGRLVLCRRNAQGAYYQTESDRDIRELGGPSEHTGGIYLPDDRTKPAQIYIDGLLGAVKYGGAGIEFTEGQAIIPNERNFRRELVYSGVSKGTISLLYREFVHDFARPAFSVALTYDLSAGNEIGYKGARFKILDASNTGIRYVVLKPLEGE